MRIKKLFLAFAWLFSVYQGKGQNIDSLRLEFQTSLDATETRTMGLMLGKAYLYKNQDSAAYYFTAARTALLKIDNDSLYIKVYERSSALSEFKGNNA